jgi:hypothetical protein
MKKQISMMMKGILFNLLGTFSLMIISSMELYSGNVFGQNDPETNDMFYTFGIDNINDSIARRFKALGVTSIESYVTWETCERAAEGKWDWTEWDRTVKVLEDNGLKWVPFLILGPAYSTPDWFRMSRDHYPCRCLEHGFDNQVESLWNPNLPKWIERFIAEFAKRYKDRGVIESVLLGIQGDFGEAIYSVTGGGWTFKIPGVYHNHQGFWCDDPNALADFRKFMRKRYIVIGTLNKAWGTTFADFEETDFPGRKEKLTEFRKVVASGDPQARRRWVDFVDWYRSAMTDWADWWMGVTREYFPDTPIYLCTGGDGIPEHGSNFAEQTRVAAKHDAGVRITNEASNYQNNFAITRWVASAGKHYGTYFGFEPAGAEDEKGIIARIYNATASGANQLHDYANNVTGSQSRIEVQQAHLKYLFHVPEPIVPVALWYPNVSMTIKWGGYFQKVEQLRDYIDFDYIDESMLRTEALAQKRILVIIHGEIMEPSDARIIADWIKNGGHVIVMDVPRFESVEGTFEPEEVLFGEKESTGRAHGKGSITRVSGWDALSEALRKTMTKLKLPVCDLVEDGIFVTQIEKDRWFFLNTSVKSSKVRITQPGMRYEVMVNPETITDTDLSKK